MTDSTSIGDRMKRYEGAARVYLTPRMPLIVRIDGRAFHTYTKKLRAGRTSTDPWNGILRDALTEAARELLREISGAKIAYLQSDEISVLVTDYDKRSSQPWFDKSLSKMCSVSASIATMAFNNHIREYVDRGFASASCPATATFDSRAYCVPREDVTNYFVWRQRDAEKNSISMLAQHYFSHRELHGKSGPEKKDMLAREHGIRWESLHPWKKRGWCVGRKTATMTYAEFAAKKETAPRSIADHDSGPRPIVDPRTKVTRTLIDADWEIPVFTRDRQYLESVVNVDLDEDTPKTEDASLLDTKGLR